MMLRTDMEHLPWPMREEIRRIVGMLFDAFAEATKGKLSDQYRQGRIIKLLLHGPHAQADWQDLPPGEAIHLLAIAIIPNWRVSNSAGIWSATDCVGLPSRSAWPTLSITSSAWSGSRDELRLPDVSQWPPKVNPAPAAPEK